MIVRAWAAKWGIPLAAIEDLERRMGMRVDALTVASLTDAEASEARAVSEVRLEASRKNVRLWRNNNGAFKDASGRVVRYGLANDSAKLNRVLKSPDLIGWKRVLIEPRHVGMVIGQSVLREVKHKGWTHVSGEHEEAQAAFIELAVADGCDARFCTGEGTL